MQSWLMSAPLAFAPAIDRIMRDGRLYSNVSDVDWSQYDFIDLGASKGGSLTYCSKRFGSGRSGIGVDMDKRKAELTAAAGHDVLVADALTLDVEQVVRFVSMFDFLEHLPSMDTVERLLRRAAQLATCFLVIHHPSFEGEGFVEHLGVRQYWWDWTGHTAHPQVADYCRWFGSMGLHRYAIHYREPVVDTSHGSLIPLGLPRNQHEFDPASHPAKPLVRFARPLWRSQRFFVDLGNAPDAWDRLVKRGML